MRIYLAGPSAELERVKAAAAEIEAAGHTITERWWERVEEARSAGYADEASTPRETMAEAARRNEAGIDTADAVIALCRSEGGISTGTSYEIGYAKGRAPLFIVGDTKNHVGTHTLRAVYGTVADALTLVGAL